MTLDQVSRSSRNPDQEITQSFNVCPPFQQHHHHNNSNMPSTRSNLPSPNHLLLLPPAPRPLKIARRSQTSPTQSSVVEEQRSNRRPPGPPRHPRPRDIHLLPRPPSPQQPTRTSGLTRWRWLPRGPRQLPRLPRTRCRRPWQSVRASSPAQAGLTRRGRRTRPCPGWPRPPAATAAASTPRPAGVRAPPPPSSAGAAASEAPAAPSRAAPSLPPRPSRAAPAPRRARPSGRPLCRPRLLSMPRHRARTRPRLLRPRPRLTILSSNSSCPRPRRTRASRTGRRCLTS